MLIPEERVTNFLPSVFSQTSKGLEDQLLGEVVRKERPDLEEAKDRLVVSISNDKKQLQDLEDKARACN
jgi:dynein heavy chain